MSTSCAERDESAISKAAFSNKRNSVTFDEQPQTNGGLNAKHTKDASRESFLEKYMSYRWITVYMCLIVYAIGTMLQNCTGMVLICMETNYRTSFRNVNQSNTTVENDRWNIIYDTDVRGTLLTADYYGLPFTPLIGGYISGRFSAKRVIAAMLFSLVILSSSIPIIATISPYAVIAIRCIIGITSGVFQPAMTVLLSSWAPLSDRARMVSTAVTGIILGIVLNFSLSGQICQIPLLNGWPFILYIFSGCNILILVCWICLVYDSPYEHPRVTLKEINIIRNRRKDSTAAKMPRPPWLKILTSGPFFGILLIHMAHGFNGTTTGVYLPIYMNDVLKFDIAANGLLSSLPQISRIVGTFASGYLADKCLSRGLLSITAVRKTFQTAGNILSVPFLIALSYMGSSQSSIAVALMVCWWLINSINSSCFRVNHIDIAPRFAGVIFGMTGTMSFVSCLLSPIVTFELTKNRTKEEWQVVFFICSGISVVTALIYLVIGSGVEQEWAKDPMLNIEFSVDGIDKTSEKKRENEKMNSQLENVKDEPSQYKTDNQPANTFFYDNKGFSNGCPLIYENEMYSSEKHPAMILSIASTDMKLVQNNSKTVNSGIGLTPDSVFHDCNNTDAHIVHTTKL